jgi:hypothetical protein
MDSKHPTDQDLIAFVRNDPVKAAAELQRLRSLKAWLIATFEMAQTQLAKPMPDGLDLVGLMGEYAERSGVGRGTITAALSELKK